MGPRLSGLFLIFISILADHAVLSKPNSKFVRIGNKIFYIGRNFKASWDLASKFCQHHEMKLATIRSKEEQNKLERAFNTNCLRDKYWIGGTDLAQMQRFVWMSDTKSLSYAERYSYEPDKRSYCEDRLEPCMELRYHEDYGDWMSNNYCCNEEKYFICEFYRTK